MTRQLGLFSAPAMGGMLGAVLGLLSCLTAVWAENGNATKPTLEIVAREPARYPEGLAEVAGAVWYAEMAANRISRWRDRVVTRFPINGACGPTSVEAYGAQLLVLCHLANNILLLDHDGRVLHRQSRSIDGHALYHPNDAVRDARGGVYFSSSGNFKADAPIAGSVFYLHGNGSVRRVAAGIHYANGVALDPASGELLVSEHLGRRVLAFEIVEPGQLGDKVVRLDLRATLRGVGDWRVGPDGLEVSADGRLRIALYGLGQLLVVSSGSTQRVNVPMRYVTTVLSYADDQLVVGGTYDLSDPNLRGQVAFMKLRK